MGKRWRCKLSGCLPSNTSTKNSHQDSLIWSQNVTCVDTVKKWPISAQCSSLSSHRDPISMRLLISIPLTFQDHPLTGSMNSKLLTQLILDSTHASIVAKLPMNKHLLFQIEKQSRLLPQLNRVFMEKMNNLQ